MAARVRSARCLHRRVGNQGLARRSLEARDHGLSKERCADKDIVAHARHHFNLALRAFRSALRLSCAHLLSLAHSRLTAMPIRLVESSTANMETTPGASH